MVTSAELRRMNDHAQLAGAPHAGERFFEHGNEEFLGVVTLTKPTGDVAVTWFAAAGTPAGVADLDGESVDIYRLDDAAVGGPKAIILHTDELARVGRLACYVPASLLPTIRKQAREYVAETLRTLDAPEGDDGTVS